MAFSTIYSVKEGSSVETLEWAHPQNFLQIFEFEVGTPFSGGKKDRLFLELTLYLISAETQAHRLYRTLGCISRKSLPYCKDMDESKAKLMTGNICCLGATYVGVPASTVIAHMCPSLNVAVADLDPDKITQWNTKQIPTREPGLEEMLKKCQNRNLVFTADTGNAIKSADIIFISMITPVHSYPWGEEIPDFTDIEKAARLIAEASEGNKIIVQKAAVPSGGNEVIQRILDMNKDENTIFQVLTIPEFFSAGNAINNLLNPDRVLIGSDKTKEALEAVDTLISIYSQWVPREKIITMSNSSAELSKLSVNAFLAQRLASVSAMSMLCERTGADITDVVNVVGRCSAVGPQYLEPSISLGGSNLKKDLMCLVFMCERLNLVEAAEYWKEVLLINEHQQKRFKKKIFYSFLNTLAHKKIAIWGVAFKRNVEIAKDSPAVDLCHSLLKEGAKLRVYDPKVEKRQLMEELTLLGVKNSEKTVTYYDDPYKAANKAHAIIICTDWEEFGSINYSLIYKDMMRPAYIFDGRKCLPHDELRKIGFIVQTIGKNYQQNSEHPDMFLFI